MQEEPTREPKEKLEYEKSSQTRKQGSIYFKDDKAEFPKTSVGKSSTIKVKLCNNAKVSHLVCIVLNNDSFYTKSRIQYHKRFLYFTHSFEN